MKELLNARNVIVALVIAGLLLLSISSWAMAG